MTEINLLRTEITSFRGISSDAPVILDFTQSKTKGKKVVKLEGDQGTGKTSTIQALLYALTGLSDFKIDTLVNREDETIKLENEFIVEDERYRVYATKSKFELQRFVGGKGRQWMAEDNPKTLLRQLIGVVATSPMHLQTMSGEKQIDWFRKTFSADSEKLELQEKKLRESLKVATASRTDANRGYTSLQKSLSQNRYYNERQKYDSLFGPKAKTVISKESAEVAFNNAQSKLDLFNAGKAKVAVFNEKIDESKRRIDELKAMLQQEEINLRDLEEKKKTGEQWIRDNEGATENFEAAKEAFMNVSELLQQKKDYQLMVTQEEEMQEYETLVQKFDNQKDDLAGQLRELTKQFLPAIPGLEIKIADGLTDTEEGIFLNGKSLAMLSESELWGLFFMIWQEKDVQFIFIENIQDLGSHAIELLNSLVQNGVKVFASQMDRKKDSIKITFTDTIK